MNEWQSEKVFGLNSLVSAVILCLWSSRCSCNCPRCSEKGDDEQFKTIFLLFLHRTSPSQSSHHHRRVRMNGKSCRRRIKLLLKKRRAKHQRNSQNVIQITISSRSTFSVELYLSPRSLYCLLLGSSTWWFFL